MTKKATCPKGRSFFVNLTDEQYAQRRKKIALSQRGASNSNAKPPSDVTRRRISKALSGSNHWTQKQEGELKGRLSEEHKKRIGRSVRVVARARKRYEEKFKGN